ncbi:MAG: serine hydrolase [Saprospiraceae bacterium]|nr:serine hydrolase [Saprospiraceae bacterium]
MRIKIYHLICLLLLIVTLYSCQRNDTVATLKITDPIKLNNVLNHYVAEDYYPFVYARLENLDGDVLYEYSSVNENLLPDTKINGNTWIRIWSMSKIVTISIVLDLIEEGVLEMNDPVSKYIPEFENLPVAVSNTGKSLTEYEWGKRDAACPIKLVPNDSIMTVRQLIVHEAGFYYATTGYSCLDSMIASKNLPKSKNSVDLISRMAQLPLIQHSGTKYHYGTNTTVLGLVAERATGKSLKQLVKERVTEPMKIQGLQYGLPANEKLMPKFTGRDSILRIAHRGELDIFGPDVPDYNMEHQLYLGGEGMVGTADGYADFIRMLLNGGELNGYRFLNKETVKDIYAPQTQLDNPYGHDGYNLWVSGDSMRINEQGEAGLWIGGGYECTHFWADPKRKFVGIIMSQNNEVRPPGYALNDNFRGELYKQLWENEKSDKN